MKKHEKLLSTREISVFCLQITYLLKAGIPLHDGVESTIQGMEKNRIQETMENIAQGLKNQKSMHEVLRDSGAFPEYLCNMAEIGDASGRLEEVMGSLAEYYERENLIQQRLKSAVLYPTMLFCMMSVVVAVLVFKVLPMFEKIFRQLGGTVSTAAGAMMYFGIAVGTVALVIIGIAVLLVLLFSVFSKTKKGKYLVETILTDFPLTKSLLSKISARRFADAMALMLSSGVGTKQALEMTRAVIDNQTISTKIDRMIQSIESGMDITEAAIKANAFPDMFSRMMGIGFRTGAPDSVMRRLASIYEEDVDACLDTVLSFVEPFFVGIVAVVIGMILIAVLLPLTGVMAAIG